MTLPAEHLDNFDDDAVTQPTVISLGGPRRPMMSDPQGDASGDGRPSLRIIRGPQRGLTFTLNSELMILGRSGSADIALDDTTVSRRHAEFRRSDGRVVLRDAGSLNGTYVNRQPIAGEVELSDGDEVWTGKYRMVYRNR